jgi:hypothetical protein
MTKLKMRRGFVGSLYCQNDEPTSEEVFKPTSLKRKSKDKSLELFLEGDSEHLEKKPCMFTYSKEKCQLQTLGFPKTLEEKWGKGTKKYNGGWYYGSYHLLRFETLFVNEKNT